MSGFVAFGGARTIPRHHDGASPQVSGWAPLRRRVFFALWIAALASNLGTWMQNVGAAWLMTSLSKSALMVSLIQTASSLPIFFLALPAGALADIVDRRRLLIFSQLWMLVAAGILGILTWLGMTTEWTVLGLSFMLGIGSALNAPAWQAIIPELVPREELTSAITLNGINFNLARAAGPALGGFVVAWFGADANFLLNAASFLGVMVVLYEWRRQTRPGVLPAERVLGAIRVGVRYVRYAPPLRAVLVRTVAFVFGASAMWAVLPLIARVQLGLGAAGFGLLLAWFGLGAVIGGAMLTRLQQLVSHDNIVHGAAVLFILMTVGLTLDARHRARERVAGVRWCGVGLCILDIECGGAARGAQMGAGPRAGGLSDRGARRTGRCKRALGCDRGEMGPADGALVRRGLDALGVCGLSMAPRCRGRGENRPGRPVGGTGALDRYRSGKWAGASHD